MLILQNESLTVSISPLGAEIQSIQDANQTERIWHGDPAYWEGRTPVLFPVAGKLKDGVYYLDGSKYAMPMHGFARRREFSVENATQDAATFLLSEDAGENLGFPFHYAFRVRYTLIQNMVRVDYQADNLDSRAFWYGVGAHEAYACPEGIEAYAVDFDREETLVRSVLRDGLLTGETELVRDRCKTLSIEPSLFMNDTQVYRSLLSRGVTLKSPLHERSIRVEFADFDYLLIWTKPGAGFLCIEPWSNLPDTVDSDQDITKKPGMTKLLPGETRTHTHTVTFFG